MVVIGIIALLMGLLLPMLAGARKRSRKTSEIHNVRQVGMAWMVYSNSNRDMVLPGHLTPVAQKRWDITPEFPDHTEIPRDLVAPYTWRLASYIDHSHEVLHSHLPHEDDMSVLTMIKEADSIAFEPGFGYNGLFLGGWWDAVLDEGKLVPRHQFQFAREQDGTRIQVLAKSIGKVRRSDSFVAFCSSTSAATMTPNEYKHLTDDTPGSHHVVPPRLGLTKQWTQNGPDVSNIAVLTDTHIPLNRYTDQVAIFYVDGHTDGQAPGALEDMRMWVNKATSVDFSFIPGDHLRR